MIKLAAPLERTIFDLPVDRTFPSSSPRTILKMAEHKNQHFVPRCHLKPFSVQGEGLAINLYNISNDLGVMNAPVKGQCARDYFYGEDLVIEKDFQSIEGRYACIVGDISCSGGKISTHFEWLMRRFIYLQYSRTESAAKNRALFTHKMHEAAFVGSDDPEPIDLSLKAAVRQAIITFSETRKMIDDLKVCVLENRTEVDFITSDDPAVHTNRWHIQKAKKNRFGIGSAGAIFLLPLTPKIMAVCYDGDVYTVENINGRCQLTRESDVLSLNIHQFIKCKSNIYFSKWESLSEISKSFKLFSKLRPKAWHEVITAYLDGEGETGKRYVVGTPEQSASVGEGLINLRAIFPDPGIWPSVIKYRSNPIIWTNNSAAGYMRTSMMAKRSNYAHEYRRL